MKIDQDREEWMAKGACAGLAHEIETFDPWFPERGSLTPMDYALELCDACSVLYECRDYSLRTNQRDGVWGGLSGAQRRTLRRRMRRTEGTVFEDIRELLDEDFLAKVS